MEVLMGGGINSGAVGTVARNALVCIAAASGGNYRQVLCCAPLISLCCHPRFYKIL